MKSYLLYPDKDYIKTDNKSLYQDIWYDTIVNHLCVYDKHIKEIYLNACDLMSTDVNVIKYRQDILKDFIKNKQIMKNYYSFLNELLTMFYNNRFEMNPKKVTESFNAVIRIYPDTLVGLENVYRYFDKYHNQFSSNGLKSYMERYMKTMSLEYIEKLYELKDLTLFTKGYFTEASLDDNLNIGNIRLYDVLENKKEIKKELHPTGVQLRNKVSIFKEYEYDIKEDKKWKHAHVIENPKALAASEEDYMSFTDEALLNIAPRICNLFNDIYLFFQKSREEMAFYIGAINLYDKLMELNLPICSPVAHNKEERCFKCDGLYDVALALQSKHSVIGNTLDSASKEIFFITGANQGGKTTFLRSYGQAIIMMQLGLFVSGSSFESNTYENIFTHFNKEEDKTMESGKLDEELGRLDEIIVDLKPNSLILFNESFQSTSELEGSTIAYDVIRALNEKHVMVVAVSHMYHLYTLLEKDYQNNVYYLRASRDDSGTRSYKLINEKPLRTSFALDLYEEIF